VKQKGAGGSIKCTKAQLLVKVQALQKALRQKEREVSSLHIDLRRADASVRDYMERYTAAKFLASRLATERDDLMERERLLMCTLEAVNAVPLIGSIY